MMRTELTIAGVGGQGSILAGVILGSAAVTYDNKYAVQTQAYSSELRGGFACAWVVVSDEPVAFPRVTRPSILVAQASDSITRFASQVDPEGTLVFDCDMITDIPDNIKRVFKIPATSIARNDIKVPVTANMVMLGALCKATGVVGREALEKSITTSVPKGKEQLNLDAFSRGYDQTEQL
jgi:2-oxoglutarate ferredoxin oxidoreductase subunit gamma